jgi:hypothetical protein
LESVVENLLTFYALLALGLGLALYLFVTMKREIGKGHRRQAALEASLERLNAGLGEVAAKLAQTEERMALLVAPAPPRSGLNLGMRSQALRMSRRGDTPQQISAALEIPQRQVELMLKVQRLAMETAAGPLADDGPAKSGPTGWEKLQTNFPRAPLGAANPAAARA